MDDHEKVQQRSSMFSGVTSVLMSWSCLAFPALEFKKKFESRVLRLQVSTALSFLTLDGGSRTTFVLLSSMPHPSEPKLHLRIQMYGA